MTKTTKVGEGIKGYTYTHGYTYTYTHRRRSMGRDSEK